MSVSALASVALEPLARTGEGSKSGPIGLAVILLLIIACYFLFKSMSGHLRRVREDFPKDAAPDPAQAPVRPRRADFAARKPETPVIEARRDGEQPPDQS